MSIGYREHALGYEQVRPRGLLGDRCELSLDKHRRDREPLSSYIDWGADQVGRTLGAVCSLGAVTKRNVADDLRALVEKLICSQGEGGLFYEADLAKKPDRKRQVWFGHGRGVGNLLEYLQTTGDQSVAPVLLKAADTVLAGMDDWTISNPICAGIESVLGTMVRLAKVTGNKAYLECALYLADNVDQDVAQPSVLLQTHRPIEQLQRVSVPHGHHTHSFLNITHGLVDLAAATGETRYLDRAEHIFERTLPSMWITGDIPEGYGELYEHNDEICSVVDFIMLGLKLFGITSERRYLDVAELGILNHFFFGQDYEGGFTADRSFDRREWVDTQNWGCIADCCCTMHGGWMLGQIATWVITEGEDGISVNLPLEVEATLDSLRVRQDIRIESTALVQEIKIENDRDEDLSARLRVPYWCDSPSVVVDGVDQATEGKNEFLVVECARKKKTVIRLQLPMRLQVIPARRHVFNQHEDAAPGSASESGIMYGPFVLMFDREIHQDIEDRDIAVTVPLDESGSPVVSQDVPESWRQEGAVPLFIHANDGSGRPIRLTPSANMTMNPFAVADPYVLRFSEVCVE